MCFARNNNSLQNGVYSTYASNSTSVLPRLTSDLTSVGLVYSGYQNTPTLINTGLTLSTLVNAQPAGTITINSMTVPIETQGTRGNLGLGGGTLAKIDVELSGGDANIQRISTVTYGDWAVQTASTPLVDPAVSLTPGNASDERTDIINEKFYRKALITGLINITANSTQVITPSKKPYRLVVRQYNKDASSNPMPALPTVTREATFYYDTHVTSVPVASVIASLNNTTGATYVSGIQVVSSPVFDISYTMTNAGNYTYFTPFATYSTANSDVTPLVPPTETDLTKITVGYDSGLKQITQNPITVVRDSISGIVTAPTLKTSVTFQVTPKNIAGTGSAATYVIPLILDKKSTDLIATTTKLPSSVQGLASSGVAKPGYHVKSSSSLPALSGTVAATYPNYDHTESLLTIGNESLQIVEGKFVTKQAANSYMDYATYYYAKTSKNTLDYTGIPSAGYRYATFLWNFNNISPKQFQNSMTLTLHNASGIISSAGNLNIDIAYRFVETGIADTIPSNGNIYNTVWISGSTTNVTQGAPAVTSTNYFSGDKIGLVDLTTASGNASIELKLAGNITKPVTAIVRIGLPMNTDISFEYASLYSQTT